MPINWGGGSSGGGGGGTPYVLPQNLQRINEHLIHDPNGAGGLGQLNTDLSLGVPLNTLWLSDQWGVSSGGDRMVLRSLDQLIDYMPVTSGVRKQHLPANQDGTGIIEPFYRNFSQDLQQLSLKGTLHASATTFYQGITDVTTDPATNAEGIGVFGVRAILGESLDLGDRLVYRIWAGPDDTGDLIFTQTITTTAARAVGFDFTGWWTHPSEAKDGDQVYARIVVQPVADRTNERTLTVRATVEDVNVHWNELQLRTFEDTPIRDSGVTSLVPDGTGTLQYLVTQTSTFSVDTALNPATITIDESFGLNMIEVFDATQSFSVSNPCTVDFGATQGLATLQTKNDHYKFYRVGNVWHFLDQDSKNGGIV